MPTPPKISVLMELDGPYDAEIPTFFIKQLKINAQSINTAGAIPYIFLNVGMHFTSLQSEERALHFFDRAIAEFRKYNNVEGEATATNRKISALCRFGKIQDAYHVVREAEKTNFQTSLAAFILYGYGLYFLSNGDYVKALDYFRKSLQANIRFNNSIDLMMLRRDSELEYGRTLILAYYFPVMSEKSNFLDFDEALNREIRRKTSAAVSHLNQAIALNNEMKLTDIGRLSPEISSQITETDAYNYLGLSYGIQGQPAMAINSLKTASDLAFQTDCFVAQIDSIFFRNHVYLLEKMIPDGEKAALELKEIADRYRLSYYQIWSRYVLALYNLSHGDDDQSIYLIQDAITIIEKQPFQKALVSFQRSSLFNRLALYERLMELLAHRGDYKGALETAERIKSKNFADLLASEDISRTPAEKELVQQYHAYRREIENGYQKLLSAGSFNLASKDELGRIARKEEKQNDIIARIKEQNAEQHYLIFGEPMNADEMLHLLDKNTTLFSYYASDRLLYIWAVNKNRVHLERIKIKKENAAGLIASFNDAITAQNRKQVKALSEKIYNIFLKPVISFVAGDRIGFIPHGPLCYLPFAAMSYKGRYLIDGFSIFYLPTAGMLKYMMQKHHSSGVRTLALGNPDTGDKQLEMFQAEMEVNNIKKIIPQSLVFIRAEAVKSKVREMISHYDVVHFAAHGQYAEDAPLNSSLRLAAEGKDDGRLTAGEIFKLQFKGRVIVMSACQTVVSHAATGLEIIGLNSAFLYAGSPAVVATLWNINKKSKIIFMDIFYKKLEKIEKITDLLRETQLEMIIRGFQPYDWAAFNVTGTDR